MDVGNIFDGTVATISMEQAVLWNKSILTPPFRLRNKCSLVQSLDCQSAITGNELCGSRPFNPRFEFLSNISHFGKPWTPDGMIRIFQAMSRFPDITGTKRESNLGRVLLPAT
ncbi:uncharacterized protein LOC144476834 isoform X4 [Augochlora pura]